jgi:hypothetical protein
MNDQVKEDEMGRTCSIEKECIRGFGEKPKGKEITGKT